MESREIRARKHSSTDGLIRVNHETFGLVKDRRSGSVVIPIVDALMSAFAMFSLKCSLLLAFEDERNHPNLRRIYRIERPPSDTRMREILDGIGGKARWYWRLPGEGFLTRRVGLRFIAQSCP